MAFTDVVVRASSEKRARIFFCFEEAAFAAPPARHKIQNPTTPLSILQIICERAAR
jgi:hypothetical protein